MKLRDIHWCYVTSALDRFCQNDTPLARMIMSPTRLPSKRQCLLNIVINTSTGVFWNVNIKIPTDLQIRFTLQQITLKGPVFHTVQSCWLNTVTSLQIK